MRGSFTDKVTHHAITTNNYWLIINALRIWVIPHWAMTPTKVVPKIIVLGLYGNGFVSWEEQATGWVSLMSLEVGGRALRESAGETLVSKWVLGCRLWHLKQIFLIFTCFWDMIFKARKAL